MINNAQSYEAHINHFISKDIWTAAELGIKPHQSGSLYKINFSRLEPYWFKLAVKQFVRFQSATRTMCTCKTYVTMLINFSIFITREVKIACAQQINRALIVDFIAYINKQTLKPASKRGILINLRTFLEIAAFEGWLSITKERLIFDSDIPGLPEPIPRFIPDSHSLRWFI